MQHIHFFGNIKVTAKFILWFLLVALIPLIIATYVSYERSRKAIEDETSKTLFLITDNKAFQINSFLTEKEKNATTISYAPEMLDIMEKFSGIARIYGTDSPEYAEAEKEFKPYLSYYQKTFGYDDLMLTDANGNIVFRVRKENKYKSIYETALYRDSEMAKVFIKAKSSLKTETSSFEYAPTGTDVYVYIASPVLKGADFVGMVIAQMSNTDLSKIVSDHSGLGDTGETIVVAKIGRSIVYITPLRFKASGPAAMNIDNKLIREITTNRTIYGTKQSGVYRDYREKEVIAVWKYIPTFRLGMLVKMDRAEVLASSNELRDALFTIGFLLLTIVIVVAILAANSISKPITELTKVSRTIARGDLSARAIVQTTDEIGELAGAFNHMTDSLVEAKNSVEQKKSELEEQKQLLEEANKELDNFVHTASHDLMAPPIEIGAYAGLIEETNEERIDQQGKLYLNRIKSSAQRMKMLIDDLLTLSKISRIKNPFENTDMNKLLKNVLERMDFDIRENNAKVKVAEHLPIVYCDRIKISEVFFNLISNGIKFASKKTGSSPEIEVGFTPKPDVFEFSVKDNGIGIDKKHHKEIFVLFKRLHTQDQYDGTGAGLSIVKRIIVDDHSGAIWLDSEPGKGTTFYFTIPRRKV